MTTPVNRPDPARMESRRAAVRSARKALDEHRAGCTPCAVWWEPCEAGIALMRAETSALDALDLERTATTDKENP